MTNSSNNETLPNDFTEKVMAKIKKIHKEPKGFHFTKTNDIEKATHWLAKFDEDWIGYESKITPYQFYRIYLDKYENEYVIIDNEKTLSLIYLCHEGEFVILDKIIR